MASRRTWLRGGTMLGLVVVLAWALLATPVGAARKGITKAKARRVATKVFHRNIGPAIAGVLSTGSIVVQAQDDPTLSYVDDASGISTVNTVSISAPSSGLFIISGQIDIDNDDSMPRFANLDVTIDGTDATPNGKAAGSELDEDTEAMDETTLSYTIARAVAAGAHTVTQHAACCTDFDYDGNELTVLFVPTGAVARTASKGDGPESSVAGGDA